MFQKVVQAPRGQQLKISGNIVNLTADINNTVNMSPRLPNQMATIKVNLNRALQFIQVAKWLIDTSILYKREGITLNPEWNHNSLHETDTEKSQEHSDYNASTCANRNENLKETAVENEDNWSEGDVETPAGVSDTLLTAPDFLEDTGHQNVLNVAPGEGNARLSTFKYMHSEDYFLDNHIAIIKIDWLVCTTVTYVNRNYDDQIKGLLGMLKIYSLKQKSYR